MFLYPCKKLKHLQDFMCQIISWLGHIARLLAEISAIYGSDVVENAEIMIIGALPHILLK